jgi:ATP-binding cassette subfamily B protein
MREGEAASERSRQIELLGRLLRLAGGYWAECLGLLALQVVLLSLGLAGLAAAGWAIDYLRVTAQPGPSTFRFPFGWTPPPDWQPIQVLAVLGGIVCGAAALRAGLSVLNAMAANRLGQGRIVVELRARVYARMQKLSFRFFDANPTGSLINRVTGDVQSVRLFVDGVLLQAVGVIVSGLIYLATMIRIHQGLALACLAYLPILLTVVMLFARWLRKDYEEGRERMDTLVRTFEELARGIGVIKSFGLESWAAGRFLETNNAVTAQKRRLFHKLTVLSPMVSLLNQIGMVILLGYGGLLAIRGEIPVGTGLMVFAGVLQQLSAQVNAVGGIADNLQQTLTGAERVYEILDAPDGLPERPGALPLPQAQGEIRFEQVDFRFEPKATVLHGIDLVIRPGEKVAIVGPTGSGKSALVSLIPRFYDPDRGRVRLDGRDLRDWRLEDVRHQVGVVFQESFLFRASVAANISFGNPSASREAIERAARLASAAEFIERLPGGYDSVLHENGANLSGGQRQRLALARAILLNPAILILDDPTAAVDAGTEHEILEAMEGVMAGRTTVLIAHRFSTVRRADRIVVLDGGRIVACGTHGELAEVPGYYRDALLSEKGGAA